MIEYIIPQNIDDRILHQVDKLLKEGKIVCFPTDTNWILVASSVSKVGIDKLYKIKHESKQKHFSLLCSNIAMASEVAIIDNSAFKLLKKLTPGNYTFIFEATKKIAKLIQASKMDKEVGIRWVPIKYVNDIIDFHGQALVSTNIPLDLLDLDDDSTDPVYSYLIEDKMGHRIDLIIDPGEHEFSGPSTIIDFSQGTGPMLVREGAGDVSFIE